MTSSARVFRLVLAGVAALAVAALSGAWPSAQVAPAPPPSPSPHPGEAMARKVCTGCHAFPPPASLPKERWKTIVMEMAALTLAGIGAPPGAPPPVLDFDPDLIGRFYETSAPDSLAPPAPWPDDPNAARYARHPLSLPGATASPTVANVRFFDLDGRGRVQVVAADMGAGVVVTADPADPQARLRVIGRVPHPCHVEAVDLDRDGKVDLVVSDLGAFPPGDYLKGTVVWMRRLADGTYRNYTLASGLPRVADVEAADMDGDGDLDLVVGAFGWREVGGVLLLENKTTSPESPVFVKHEIDRRPGSIHVPVTDINKDGKPDVVALLAQHFETVMAYLGDGTGRFRAQPLWAAPHPAWGSSGLALVDFDRDGDDDLLVTNGDMLDDFLLKPYHGIRWLENRGGLSFEEHELAALPGVHRALAADLDLDGDLDVVACAFVPPHAPEKDIRAPRTAPPPSVPSLIWLEQTAPGRFERHALERGASHVSLDVADYDQDGDPDLVVASFGQPQATAWIEVWENLARKR